MAPKASSLTILFAAALLSICSEGGAHGLASSPVSDNIGRTFTATKEMAQDVVNSAAPKAGEVGQAVKDTAKGTANAAGPAADKVGRVIKGTAKSATDSIAPVADKAGDAAKEATNSLGSWFKDKLANLGIISRGLAEPVRSPSSPATTKSPASAPVKRPWMP